MINEPPQELRERIWHAAQTAGFVERRRSRMKWALGLVVVAVAAAGVVMLTTDAMASPLQRIVNAYNRQTTLHRVDWGTGPDGKTTRMYESWVDGERYIEVTPQMESLFDGSGYYIHIRSCDVVYKGRRPSNGPRPFVAAQALVEMTQKGGSYRRLPDEGGLAVYEVSPHGARSDLLKLYADRSSDLPVRFEGSEQGRRFFATFDYPKSLPARLFDWRSWGKPLTDYVGLCRQWLAGLEKTRILVGPDVTIRQVTATPEAIHVIVTGYPKVEAKSPLTPMFAAFGNDGKELIPDALPLYPAYGLGEALGHRHAKPSQVFLVDGQAVLPLAFCPTNGPLPKRFRVVLPDGTTSAWIDTPNPIAGRVPGYYLFGKADEMPWMQDGLPTPDAERNWALGKSDHRYYIAYCEKYIKRTGSVAKDGDWLTLAWYYKYDGRKADALWAARRGVKATPYWRSVFEHIAKQLGEKL